jgi:diguanylate cyclase (GGDEF)-like protein
MKYQLARTVLFMDLDGFESIDDAHGQDVGVELLRQVARPLSYSLRKGDWPNASTDCATDRK